MPTCGTGTRDGKPFCIDHIERMPYARLLMAIVERRDTHIDSINQGARITLDARITAEILAVISTAGSISPQRIAHVCGFPYKVVDVYVAALTASDHIQSTRTRRGSPIVRVVGAQPTSTDDIDAAALLADVMARAE